jgi:hypothetical protein
MTRWIIAALTNSMINCLDIAASARQVISSHRSRRSDRNAGAAAPRSKSRVWAVDGD